MKNDELTITSPAVEFLAIFGTLAIVVWAVGWVFSSVAHILWLGYGIFIALWLISVFAGCVKTEFFS